jgi:hypothetical protein
MYPMPAMTVKELKALLAALPPEADDAKVFLNEGEYSASEIDLNLSTEFGHTPNLDIR